MASPASAPASPVPGAGSPGPASPNSPPPAPPPPPPPPPPSFPPYPPYATEPAPQCVKECVVRGHDIRRTHKFMPMNAPVRKPPMPSRPRSTMVPAAKMNKRQAKAHNRCMRRHNAVLTSRLEYMAKPQRRRIIDMWREHAHHLPAETISRLRDMLDADVPFKPDQAYQYFVNMKKSKKKNSDKSGVNQVKKDMQAICGDRRFTWARKATIQFARGLQQRLAKPGNYCLRGGMLRLSDIILDELCGYMHFRVPSRCCCNPRSKFMLEMADKVAIWIDEILSDSEDRMLMMDYDEDDEVVQSLSAQPPVTSPGGSSIGSSKGSKADIKTGKPETASSTDAKSKAADIKTGKPETASSTDDKSKATPADANAAAKPAEATPADANAAAKPAEATPANANAAAKPAEATPTDANAAAKPAEAK